MRKLIALVCAIAMVMALAVPAFAEYDEFIIFDSIDDEIYGGDTVDDEDDDDDHDSKSDDKDETAEEAAEAVAVVVTVDPADLVNDAEMVKAADEAIAAVLTGDLAGYKPVCGWLKPSADVFMKVLAQLSGKAADVLPVVFAGGKAEAKTIGDMISTNFDWSAYDAFTFVGK